MFVMHNIAHLLCKGHLDVISALLLFHHLKLATLKEDNTDLILGWFNCCFIIMDVKIIVDECMINLEENNLLPFLPPPLPISVSSTVPFTVSI
jgi:hypothetical protein